MSPGSRPATTATTIPAASGTAPTVPPRPPSRPLSTSSRGKSMLATPTFFETAQIPEWGFVTDAPISIYTGILGQIGDIVMFTPTVRRLKDLFPNSRITFAVSRRYREAGELVAGLPYVDRLFVTEL